MLKPVWEEKSQEALKRRLIHFYRNLRYGLYHPQECINASFSASKEFSNAIMITEFIHKDITQLYSEEFKKLSKNGSIDEVLKIGDAKPKNLDPKQGYCAYGRFENYFSVYKLRHIQIKGEYPLAYIDNKVIGDCAYQNYSNDRLFKQIYFNELEKRRHLNIIKDREIKKIDRALLLTSKWNHFSHFISEHIYKIRYLKKSISQEEFKKIKFIVEKNFPQWKIDLLKALDIDIDKLILWDNKYQYNIENFYLTTYPEPNYDNLIWLKKSLQKFLNINEENISKKIYLSRNRLRTKSRTIVNEKELIIYLRKNNFDVLYPECMSFYEQVKVFSKASIIIGSHGAAHVNSLFANNSKIVEFQGDYTRIALAFYATAKVLDHSWDLLICEENPQNRSIKVNIQKLDILLKKLQN